MLLDYPLHWLYCLWDRHCEPIQEVHGEFKPDGKFNRGRDHGVYCPGGHIYGKDCIQGTADDPKPAGDGNKGDHGKKSDHGHGNVKHHGHGSGDHGKHGDGDGMWDGNAGDDGDDGIVIRPIETEEERRKRLLEEERLRKEREEQRLLDAHREMLRARMLKEQQDKANQGGDGDGKKGDRMDGGGDRIPTDKGVAKDPNWKPYDAYDDATKFGEENVAKALKEYDNLKDEQKEDALNTPRNDETPWGANTSPGKDKW